MLTGIHAPTAWPFLGPHPPAGVFRTALGTVLGIPGPSLTLAGINLLAGEMLAVGVGYVLAVGALPVADINGNALVNVGIRASSNLLRGIIFKYVTPASIIGGTITVTWPVGGYIGGIVASKFSGIVGTTEEFISASFVSTTSPDSGITLDYGFPNVGYGLIATNGLAADALGVWQPSAGALWMHAGQRVSLALLGLDVKEGYRIIGAPLGGQARITGQTLRRSVALFGLFD